MLHVKLNCIQIFFNHLCSHCPCTSSLVATGFSSSVKISRNATPLFCLIHTIALHAWSEDFLISSCSSSLWSWGKRFYSQLLMFLYGIRFQFSYSFPFPCSLTQMPLPSERSRAASETSWNSGKCFHFQQCFHFAENKQKNHNSVASSEIDPAGSQQVCCPRWL